MLGELQAHRDYLQTMDENFFNRLGWIGSIIVALFIIFGALLGKLIINSTNAFINNAKEDASKKAEEEIAKIVNKENLLEEFKKSQAELLKEQTIVFNKQVQLMSKEFQNDLKKIKDSFVENQDDTLVSILKSQV